MAELPEEIDDWGEGDFVWIEKGEAVVLSQAAFRELILLAAVGRGLMELRKLDADAGSPYERDKWIGRRDAAKAQLDQAIAAWEEAQPQEEAGNG